MRTAKKSCGRCIVDRIMEKSERAIETATGRYLVECLDVRDRAKRIIKVGCKHDLDCPMRDSD